MQKVPVRKSITINSTEQVRTVKSDIFTGKTRGWNTGCSGENQNLHKVILVTKDKGKCVFPARRTMPRKEASANPGCPMVYHMKWNCECKNHPDWHVPYKYMNRKTISYTERNIKKIDQMATLMMPGEIKSFVEDDYSYLLTSVL